MQTDLRESWKIFDHPVEGRAIKSGIELSIRTVENGIEGDIWNSFCSVKQKQSRKLSCIAGRWSIKVILEQ